MPQVRLKKTCPVLNGNDGLRSGKYSTALIFHCAIKQLDYALVVHQFRPAKQRVFIDFVRWMEPIIACVKANVERGT